MDERIVLRYFSVPFVAEPGSRDRAAGLRHTFATWHPLEIIANFLFQIVWGLPLAAFLFIVLLVCGIISAARPYAAMFALVLNMAALGLVLFRFGLPSDFDQAVFFLPVFVALIGFAWLAYPVIGSDE